MLEFFQKLFMSRDQYIRFEDQCHVDFTKRVAKRAKEIFEREITRAVDLYGPIEIVWYNPTMIDYGSFMFSKFLTRNGKTPFIKIESEYGKPTIDILFKDGTSACLNFQNAVYDALDPVYVHEDLKEVTGPLEKPWLEEIITDVLKTHTRTIRKMSTQGPTQSIEILRLLKYS